VNGPPANEPGGTTTRHTTGSIERASARSWSGARATTITKADGTRWAPDEALVEETKLGKKLKWLILFRVAIVTCLLGAMLVFDMQRGEPPLDDASHRFIYYVAVATYLASFGYTLALRFVTSDRALILLTLAQLLGDALLAAGLVLVTGGTDSVFSFFFSLTIVNASILLFRRGAVIVATVSSLLFLLIALAEMDVIPIAELLEREVGTLLLFGRHAAPAPAQDLVMSRVYNVVINVVAFYGIAVLASYLSEQLRKSDLEHREIRGDLEDLRMLHHNIVSSIMSGLITTTRDRKISFFNHVAEEVSGHKEAQVLGRDINQLFPDLRHILANEDKLGMLTTETTVQVLRGRTTYIQWFISPLRDGQGHHVGQVLIFQDITRLKDMEAQITRSEQFAGIGKLAAGIAHEIRNPLASISGSVQLLAQGGMDPDTQRRLMGIVLRETDHLNTWITDFLEFARPRRIEKLDVDVPTLVSEIVEVFRHDPSMARSTIELVSDGTPGLVEGDSGRLKQVFWNLLKNAAQAMPDGGAVTVRLARAYVGGVPHVQVTVADTGVGISSEEIDKIFEPFYTTKDRGTGLGLATCYRIVQDHHGQIHVESQRGAGTAFRLQLPEVDAEPTDPPPLVRYDSKPLGAA
jgi:two-component system sensor histidine kinase PilS (NtrC family)